MAQRTFGRVLHCLRWLRSAEAAGASTDLQLLRRFLESRDEPAFASLVRRHAAMVLGVCRRVLDDPHDADDAFQAVFLVLVRRARTLAWHDSLGGWLHQTALRVALRARSKSRQKAALPLGDLMSSDRMPAEQAERDDLRRLLDQELDRLPPRYRDPLVLCYLEGKTYEEAAQELGWPRGSMARRLEQARERLRQRLAGRGLTLPATLAVTLAAEQSTAAAAVNDSLIEVTVRTASLVAGGTAGATGPVHGLAEGVARTMMLQRALRSTLLAILILGLAAAGMGLWQSQAQDIQAQDDVAPPPAAAQAPADKPVEQPAKPGVVRPLVSWAGAQSAVRKPTYRRITSTESWQELWQAQMKLPGDVPEVDFSQCIMVAVFQGAAVNCKAMRVVSISEEKDTLTIRFVAERDAGGDKPEVVTPYGLFLLPRTSHRLVLEEDVQNARNQPAVWVRRAQFELLRPDTRETFQETIADRLRKQPQDDGRDSELRAQVREAVGLLLDKTARFQDKFAAPLLGNQQQENALKVRIEAEQKNISLQQYKLSVILDELTARKDERAKEPAAWQAYYDYVRARLEAQIAHLYEHNAMFGEMRKEFPTLDPATEAGWRLVPTDQIKDRDAAKNAKNALSILAEMVKNHAGTEWEKIAAEELKIVQRGLRWEAYGKE